MACGSGPRVSARDVKSNPPSGAGGAVRGSSPDSLVLRLFFGLLTACRRTFADQAPATASRLRSFQAMSCSANTPNGVANAMVAASCVPALRRVDDRLISELSPEGWEAVFWSRGGARSAPPTWPTTSDSCSLAFPLSGPCEFGPAKLGGMLNITFGENVALFRRAGGGDLCFRCVRLPVAPV